MTISEGKNTLYGNTSRHQPPMTVTTCLAWSFSNCFYTLFASHSCLVGFDVAGVSSLFYRWDAWGSERLRNLLRAAHLGMRRGSGSWAFWPFWPLDAVTETSLVLHFQLCQVLVCSPLGGTRPWVQEGPVWGWAGHSCSGLICIKVSLIIFGLREGIYYF